jgi:hypothetical protein
MLSAIATKFDPRPESKMPRFFMKENKLRACHPERSEGSVASKRGKKPVPRFARDDSSS